MMKIQTFALNVMCALCFSASLGWADTGSGNSADGLTFICHKGLNYSLEDVKHAYRATLDEPHLSDNKALFGQMLAWVGLSESQYKSRWSRLFFKRAVHAPLSFDNDQSVISFVEMSPQGIGYVSSFSSAPDVEVCSK